MAYNLTQNLVFPIEKKKRKSQTTREIRICFVIEWITSKAMCGTDVTTSREINHANFQ